VSVVGFDDIRFAKYVDPPLTTIRQPMRELGEATVRLLLNILRGNLKDAVSVTLPHALIVRASTAAPRVRASIGVARG
jgi:LacI family repressor for deo operon, udp, cdd, tsx, nupC, and nupG